MLMEWMHAMMKDTDCPMALWGEAVCATAYCLNQTSTSVNGGITPFQSFEGRVPMISHMRIFYTNAYIHCSKSKGAKKLGYHAHLVKFVGYPDGVNGHKFYDPSTHTIVLSRSAHFLENPQTHIPPDTFDDNEVSVISDCIDNEHVNSLPPPAPITSIPDIPAQPSPSPPPSPIPPSPAPDVPSRQLHDCTRIHPPAQFDPAGFGAHGQHAAHLACEFFGEQMHALLTTWNGE